MSERTVKRTFKPVPECYRHDPDMDPYKHTMAREQRAREGMVAVEETKLLAEKIKQCFKDEGVNHYKNCEKLTREYFRRVTRGGLNDGPVELSDIE